LRCGEAAILAAKEGDEGLVLGHAGFNECHNYTPFQIKLRISAVFALL
jgi:hypothetical protein